MELDHSQKHQPGSSILGEMQESICDESMKRDASHLVDDVHYKSKKKRRSSLSAHRRSITGILVSAFNIETDTGSQTSTESGSQVTSAAESSQSSQESKSQVQSHLSNTVNLQMDAQIESMKERIAILDRECLQWKNLLATYQEQEKATEVLATNLTLSQDQLPDDVKELGLRKYISCKPLDLSAVKEKLDQLVLQYKLDCEAATKDLLLIKETVEAVQSSNNILRSHFSQSLEDDREDDTYGPQSTDCRQIISKYMSLFNDCTRK